MGTSDRVWLGVDPGLTGALAAIIGPGVAFHDAPVVTIKVNGATKHQLDPHACAALLRSYQTDDMLVTIEKVAPMPSFKGKGGKPQSMGVTSAFNFGMGFGVWIGVLAALGIPYQLVHPATWKRALLADMQKGKDASRVKAKQLYPHVAEELKLVKHHGRADALLLAVYGRQYGPMSRREEFIAPAPMTLFG